MSMSMITHRMKLLVLDVDGTLTDGGIYILESGEQFKRFDSKDGLGISRAIQHGLIIGVISHSLSSGAIAKRVEMLGIQRCYIGQEAKRLVLTRWCEELGISLHEVAFIGDDINDREVIDIVGISACPGNALDAIQSICDVVLENAGGHGCVREFLDRFYFFADGEEKWRTVNSAYAAHRDDG